MPDNPLPDAKTEPVAEPAEFNFSNPSTETPRIRRRTLKSKRAGLIKAPEAVPPIARELEREAPPLSPEEAAKNQVSSAVEDKSVETPAAQPKTTPAISATAAANRPASTPAAKSISTPPKSMPASGATAVSASASPHPTRPATLYYSSQPRKEKEAPPVSAPMKTIPTSNATPTPSAQPAATSRPATAATNTATASTARPAATSTATSIPTSVTRPTASTSRPSTTTDYRANIERQSREQKSVGSLLSYVVYGLIAFFVIAAALAGYGGYVLSQRISDQSVTVSQLDSKYAAANKDLLGRLATTQDALAQAQAQITRENDLIVKQQDELNRLIAATNDNIKALATEKQARTQESANLRARVRELENNQPTTTR